MSTKTIIQVVFIFFIVSVLIIGGFLYRSRYAPKAKADIKKETLPLAPVTKLEESIASEPEDETKTDRIETIEKVLTELTDKQEEQDELIANLSKKVTNTSSSPESTAIHSGKNILATAQTDGSQFTTTSVIYSPMGMYVNISCPKNCILWVNFYTISRNLDTDTSPVSHINSYGIFLNGEDKSIYTQGSMPLPNRPIPISLNAAIPVGAGTHTVDIQAKTTDGTLRSDLSQLQVLAIEQ